ncbi:MAG: biosynthetic-type acetolactate synthase large subunit [Candidatus Bathyarchaeota archaeon]|jgi:acetolactate synthase-1/2/3 large subunit|nr:biosynthetic-type acetolactate synthase large subunit [Candidatus Bathyarchaeota archaeon]
MVEMSGSKAFVEGLKRENVNMIFGVTGGAVLPICDELWGSDLRFVMARHEQGAVHMADGYARALGKVGVCLATSGPGATNLVTGIATANIDSVPVVAFTGQVPLKAVGSDAFQEVDIIGITASATKYNIQVRRPSEIPPAIKSAFHIASTGRQGAVLVDLPKDCQINVEDIEFPDEVSFRGYNVNREPDPREMDWAATLISKARRPVVMAGGGVIASNASPEVIKIAGMLMAPVVTSLMGKGSIPSDHPLFAGLCGMHGTGEANMLVSDADVLLVVGARFSDRTTASLEDFSQGSKVIHIDIDRSEVDKNVETVTRVIGDAKLAIQGIIKRLKKLSYQSPTKGDWIKKLEKFRAEYVPPELSETPHMRAPAVLRALRKVLPRNALVTTEVGQCQMWAALYFDSYAPRTFFSSGGLGTMGWGFPAAIGAKAARPDLPVVDIAGDGSFAMTENSLATAVEDDFPVIVVVLNNRMLGMVAQWQRLFYGRRYMAVRQGAYPDFVKLAEAYGAVGVRPETIVDFEKAVQTAIDNNRTTVIDVSIDPEENVFPMVPPGKGLRDILLVA